MTDKELLADLKTLDDWRSALKGRGVHMHDPDTSPPLHGGADPSLADFTDSCVLTRPRGPGMAFRGKSAAEARHLAAEAIRRKAGTETDKDG